MVSNKDQDAKTQETDLERLEKLLQARHPLISMVTYEEKYAMELIHDATSRCNRSLWTWTVINGVKDGLFTDGQGVKDTEHAAAALYHLWTKDQPCCCVMMDLSPHLKDDRTLRIFRDVVGKFREIDSTLIMLDSSDQAPPIVSTLATRFEVSYPDAEELEKIVRDTLRKVNRTTPIEVDITRRGLDTIIRNLRGLTRREAEQVTIDAAMYDQRFSLDDLHRILSRKRQMIQKGGLLEFVEAPATLAEIGGLDRLKRWLKQRQNAMSDKAAQFGINAPKGVLMLGVQGAGKSLCAKAIAAAWQRPLLRLDVGSLYDRYVGQSEKRLRDALRQAEMMSPIILWIDEIEKAFASSASRSTDGGLSQRMFGTLLTWMQEHTAPVFMVGTANDIEALPPELLRKGRFDEIFFVDLPKESTRKQIFAIHLKKRDRDPDEFDLDALAEASEGFSGAEIEQAVIGALHDAFADNITVTTDMITHVLKSSPPLSVTMAEKVQWLRNWAKDRCVPAE